MLLLAPAGTAAASHSFLPVYQRGGGVFETDLAIGNEDEDNYVLYGPWQIAVDEDGSIFVLDSKVHHFKKFDRDGRHVRTFSRPGEGPGELGTSGLTFALDPEGHVVVADFMNNRFTEFDNDGEYVGDRKAFGNFITHIEFGRDGSVYLESYDSDMQDYNFSRQKVAKYTRGFELVDVVDSMRVQSQKTVPFEGGMRSVGIPYTDGFEWRIGPDGNLVIARRCQYRIRVLSPDLETLHEVTRDVEPVAVSKADRDRFVEDMDESFRDIAREVDLPSHKPYIVAVRVDHEGYILVCRYDESDSFTNYDVFSPDGEFVHEVVLPPVRKFKVMKGGFVYGVETFDETLPQVHRYRLVPEINDEREDT
jgi:hypothetical protein